MSADECEVDATTTVWNVDLVHDQVSSPPDINNGGLPDKFPDGLRILVVDDNVTVLEVVSKLLKTCKYEVTSTTNAAEALEILRQNKNNFDLVLTDVYMDDMDGYTLLSTISLNMDIPVILMSAKQDTETIMKGIKHGARDFLLKPLRIEQVKTIWQHVVRKNMFKDTVQAPTTCVNNNDVGGEEEEIGRKNNRNLSRTTEGELGGSCGGGGVGTSCGDGGYRQFDGSSSRKTRVRWDTELHGKFVKAVNDSGGIDKAVPKKILEMMNVSGISRENIASHLQKFRNAFKKQKLTNVQREFNSVAVGGGRHRRSLSSIFPLSSLHHTRSHQQNPMITTPPLFGSQSIRPTYRNGSRFPSSSFSNPPKQEVPTFHHNYQNNVQLAPSRSHIFNQIQQQQQQQQNLMYSCIDQTSFGIQQRQQQQHGQVLQPPDFDQDGFLLQQMMQQSTSNSGVQLREPGGLLVPGQPVNMLAPPPNASFTNDQNNEINGHMNLPELPYSTLDGASYGTANPFSYQADNSILRFNGQPGNSSTQM